MTGCGWVIPPTLPEFLQLISLQAQISEKLAWLEGSRQKIPYQGASLLHSTSNHSLWLSQNTTGTKVFREQPMACPGTYLSRR